MTTASIEEAEVIANALVENPFDIFFLGSSQSFKHQSDKTKLELGIGAMK